MKTSTRCAHCGQEGCTDLVEVKGKDGKIWIALCQWCKENIHHFVGKFTEEVNDDRS